MKHISRVTTLTLAILLLLASCGSSKPDAPAATTAPSGGGETAATEPVKTEPEFLPDDLPADLDFKGQTITGLYRTDVVDSFYVAEQTGDVVNDAVNAANRAVEERLNVKLKVDTMNGSANADRTPFMNAVTNSVQAGDDAWQLIGVLAYNCPMLLQKGIFLDLLGVKHLDLDKPWWTDGLTDIAIVNGKLYFASGDISLEMTQRIFCMLFNKDMLDDMKYDNLYQIVNDGKWTLDKLKELSAAAANDANGDGVMSPGDTYGFICNDYNHTCGFVASLGMTVTTPDKDGVQHLDFGTEHDVNAISAVQKLLSTATGVLYNSESDAGDTPTAPTNRAMFMEKKVAVITAEFYHVSTYFREMESEYGVIPYPKYDENQKDYLTVARNVYSTFSIPTTCKITDAVGAMMEALASQNYRTTSRVYFETALKVKYARDNESSQMYDLIKEGMRFNFGYTFNGVENIIINRYMDICKNNTKEWSSEYATYKDGAEAKLQDFYKAVANIGK